MNLASRVPDREAEGPGPVTEVHEEIPGLLGRPGANRVGHAEQVHMAGGDLHHEQDVGAFRKIVSTWKK